MFQCHYQGQYLAGVDEVGRGPLAGPVVAAAVILDPCQPISGLKDSKKVSPKKREILAKEIKHKALAYAIARAEVEEIDEINILQASLLAMHRAIMQLPVTPEHVLIDGNQAPKCPYPHETVIQGDSIVPAISAASIIAKVERDNEMLDFAKQYPQYGFAQHKGYPTKAHLLALEQFGVTPLHRRSYAPVKRYILLDHEGV